MNYVERVLDGVHNVLNLNAATLSGAIDIVVVPQPDGTLKSTPFHVRFGKLHLLNSSEKVVTMYVNDEIVDIQLKLGNAGEAFFVEETEDFVSPSQITSPIGSPPTSPAIFKRTTEMVGGKPVVKEVQTHIDSKMEQMIIEDAQLQPQQVTVIHEDKKEKQEQKAKQKIVIDHEDHKTVLPATLPLPVNAPLTSTHPNQQSSSPVDSVTNNPRVRSESLPSYMLDTALEEMYNENPEAPTKDGKAEQESYFTWRWGGFPKYRGGKTLDQPDSDSETLAKDSAVSSKEAPPVAGWKSLFRIFKGVEPQYLVRDEEIEAAIEASDTPEALPVTDKNNEEQQPLSTSLTLSQPLQLLESSSLTTTPIFVPEEEEDSDSSSDSADYDDASSENDDPTLQFDMHFEKSKKTPEITHTSSPSTDNDKRDKPIPHTITEQITTTTTIPSNDNKEKEHLIPRLPLRSSTDGFDVIKDPPTSPKKYQSDKEESVEKKNEPLLTFEELPEIKIEISKCGHIIGPNVNDEVAKQKIFQENLVRYEDICKDPEVILDPNILFKIRDKIYPWSVVGPLMVSAVVFKKPLDPKAVEKLTNKYNEKMKIQAKKGWSYWFWGSKSVPSTPKDRTPEVPPSPKPDVRELPSNQKILQKVIKKSLRPTGDQLKVLKLKEGANSVRFSVTSKLQGTREVHGTIYLWKQDTKVVISDIDGTITKSDVMGHILPMLGRDWSHSGIAELYTNIKKNNYQILYLTARPIGQAGITRGYITTLKQGEKTLPQGPIFMSPNRLLSSFHQEVVARRPDEFKIACLKDIQSLFTNNEQVFYAGFGNRPTDFLSYRAVHVPLGKIFIINYKGEINVVKSTSYRKTYSTLNELVHEMFPPLFETVKPTTLRSSEQWNNWNYWKPPLPNIEEDLKQQQAVVQSKEKK